MVGWLVVLVGFFGKCRWMKKIFDCCNCCCWFCVRRFTINYFLVGLLLLGGVSSLVCRWLSFVVVGFVRWSFFKPPPHSTDESKKNDFGVDRRRSVIDDDGWTGTSESVC